MIAEIGLAALWAAAALALLQFVLATLGLADARAELRPGVRVAAVLQGGFVAIAFAVLIICFMRSDMSVALVATNSHSQKPWLYKFAGTWGNHEGSMLLWVAVLGVAGAAVALLERRISEATLTATLGARRRLSASASMRSCCSHRTRLRGCRRFQRTGRG